MSEKERKPRGPRKKDEAELQTASSAVAPAPPPPPAAPPSEPPAAPPSEPVAPAPPSEQPVAAPAEAEEPQASTVTVPLTASGAIAWSAVKPNSKHREKIQKAMGTAGSSLKSANELEGLAKMAPAMWQAVAAVGIWVGTLKTPERVHEKLAEAIMFSKEELDTLAGPTAAFAQKYLPAGLLDYEVEFNLASALFSVGVAKVAAVRAIMASDAEEQQGAKTPLQVVSMPQPVSETASQFAPIDDVGPARPMMDGGDIA